MYTLSTIIEIENSQIAGQMSHTYTTRPIQPHTASSQASDESNHL